MRVLVTGGCGFVGRHLADALLAQGCDVEVVDPIVPGTGGNDSLLRLHDSNLHLTWHDMDCREFFVTEDASSFDAVFHLAAIVGGRVTIEQAPLQVAVDLSLDAEMFNWADRADTFVVYFSSSAAYPINRQSLAESCVLDESLIDMDAPTLGRPDMTYGWAKLAGEVLAHHMRAQRGNVTVYRPFSGYGEDQDLAYPVPAICKREAERRKEEPARVWGPGVQVRDFVHIDDIVAAVLKTWRSGDTMNISTGVGHNFIDVARIAANDPELLVKTNVDKPTGVEHRVGATTRQDLHDVRHEVPLTDGLARCVNYWRDRRG